MPAWLPKHGGEKPSSPAGVSHPGKSLAAQGVGGILERVSLTHHSGGWVPSSILCQVQGYCSWPRAGRDPHSYLHLPLWQASGCNWEQGSGSSPPQPPYTWSPDWPLQGPMWSENQSHFHPQQMVWERFSQWDRRGHRPGTSGAASRLGPGLLSLSKDRWPRVSLWQGLKILTDQEPGDGIWSIGEAQAWQTPGGRPG